jgi:hypothetical protein
VSETAAVRELGIPGYEVLGRLGKGGMGVVYKATQKGLNRTVALKMILNADFADEEQRERFRAEAEAIARLQHPHIVQVYEVGEHQGKPYFSLEFCPGGSLDRQLGGTPWEPRRAAELVSTLAQAMHAAHLAKVIHRDLKPANVLLTAEATPKVTDFGLAKRLDEQGRTQSGAIVGTPSYMAPEQAGGKGQQIGPPTDVYALGAILYELLTGRPPFRAPTPLETVLQVLSVEPVAVRSLQPKVPKDLETICHKCLEKDAQKRYASAAALAEDLRRFLAGEPVVARPVGALGRVVKWVRRRPAVAGLLATVVLVSAAGLGGILWAYGEAVVQRDRTREEKDRADRQAARATDEALTAGLEAEKARREKKRADDEADKARKEARRADDKAAEAQRQAYLAQVGRVEAQILAGDHAAATGVLGGISPEERAWEYYYLSRRTQGTPLTLRGHTQPVASVSYSPDGSRLISRDASGKTLVWEASSGKRLPEERVPRQLLPGNVSPDGKTVAAVQGNLVQLWRRPAPPYGYDPWAEDHQRRTALATAWHAEDAQAAEQRGDWFAAAFHRRQLERWQVAQPWHPHTLGWIEVTAGDRNSYRQTCQRLCATPHDGGDLRPLFQLSGALACLPAGPGALTTPAALEKVMGRTALLRALLAARTAALSADSGVPGRQLVSLAQSGSQADVPEWQRREVLGAALYRAGQAEEAIRELQEAVRQQGAGGSTWAKLFLALSYRRLGKADDARSWRDKVQLAANADWSERLIHQQLSREWNAPVSKDGSHEKDEKKDKK